jgi:streptogramin lyase
MRVTMNPTLALLSSTLMLSAAVGCSTNRTEIVIGIATDLTAPDPLKSVDVQVFSLPDETRLSHQTFSISGDLSNAYELPGTFVVYSTGGTTDQFRAVLTATNSSGATIVERSAVLTLVPEKTLFVRFGLVSACEGITDCLTGETCIEGHCASEDLDASRLPGYTAGMEKLVMCSSGTTFVDTSTQQPLAVTGTSCGMGTCLEGICLAPQQGDAGTEDIREFSIPTSNSFPRDITAGLDGNLWFTEGEGNNIGRITTAGAFTEFSIPTAKSGPRGIAIGPDGNLWFTELNGNKIGRITPAGAITEFPIPTPNSGPTAIVAGRDGSLWFTQTAGYIGRVTTAGSISRFPTPAPSSNPADITVGRDGSLWYTESGSNNVGRITTGGSISELIIPILDSTPLGIVAGRDGSLWFTQAAGYIGRVTTAGSIAEIPVPTSGSDPFGIAAGPEGSLWFTENAANNIGRITTGGSISEFRIPTPNSGPQNITTGSDGNLWFTELTSGKIGRIGPDTTPNAAPTIVDVTGMDAGHTTDASQPSDGGVPDAGNSS